MRQDVGTVNQRCINTVPDAKGTRTSIIATYFSDGTVVSLIYRGALDKNVFRTYCKNILSKEAPQNSVIIFDNLNVHKDKESLKYLEKAGHKVIFQPQYSPDLSPAEKCWSVMKKVVRDIEPRTEKDVIETMKNGVEVAKKSIQKFFKACGMFVKNFVLQGIDQDFMGKLSSIA